MPRKFAFIGAGSFGFTRGLVRDILTFPAFADATIALMDIDPERLDYITRAVKRIVKEGKYAAKVVSTTDRKTALKGADGVLCTILSGDVDVWQHDILIPKKYGVDINVGDTRGPAGIFRFLRTAPVMLDIARDIAKYCPGAVFLNYTNPMAMLCRIIQGEVPQIVTSGLCHSVQGTAEMLAKWIGADMKDVTYTCAGINHQAFYLKYQVKGQDAYPAIRKAITENPDIMNAELVRNDLFLALDYYITESSGHNSEYVAWYRKRQSEIDRIAQATGWNPGAYAYILNEYRKRKDTWKDSIENWFKEPLQLERGHEYASFIFNAIFGDQTLYEFNGNVRNFGLIDNLPEGCCVEVPTLASPRGLSPMHVGALPPQLAVLNNISARCEELAVQGSLAGDPRAIYYACLFDPLTSAVCTTREVQAMVDEMFLANRDYLPQFKHFK